MYVHYNYTRIRRLGVAGMATGKVQTKQLCFKPLTTMKYRF